MVVALDVDVGAWVVAGGGNPVVGAADEEDEAGAIVVNAAVVGGAAPVDGGEPMVAGSSAAEHDETINTATSIQRFTSPNLSTNRLSSRVSNTAPYPHYPTSSPHAVDELRRIG